MKEKEQIDKDIHMDVQPDGSFKTEFLLENDFFKIIII